MPDEQHQDIQNTASNQGIQGIFHGAVSFDNRHSILINAIPSLGIFFRVYGSVFLLLAALYSAAWWAFPALHHRYLIPSWILLVFVVVITAFVLVAWTRRIAPIWQGSSRWWAIGGTGCLLVALLGWQVSVVLNPPRFTSDHFGIAVARFGEGAHLRGTALAADITDQLIRGIEATIRQNPIWYDTVTVLPTGLVATTDEAEERGRTLNADMVIWGQIVQGGDGLIAVNFEVVDTAEQLTGPRLPLVLPASSRFTINQVNLPLAPDEVKDLVANQGAVITAFSLGLGAYFNRDYVTAVAQFAAAEALIQPEAPQRDPIADSHLKLVYFYLGRSLQYLGDIETGRSYLERAATYDPDDPAIPLSIAFGYNSLGQAQNAHEWANKALQLADTWMQRDPHNQAVAYNRGLVYLLYKEDQRAVEVLNRLIAHHPDLYIAYLSVAQAHLNLGETDQAIRRLKEAISQAEQLGTDCSWADLLLADVYSEVGDLTQAEQHFQHALEHAPDVDWMHYRYGVFLDNQGRTEAAEAAYDTMREVTLDEPWALAQIAAFYRGHQRTSEAIKLYEDVVERRPADVFSRAYLAELYMETGRVDQARAVYTALLEEYDMFHYGHASYGYRLMMMQDYMAAIEQLEKALALDPDNEESRYNLALAYALTGQIEQAQAIFQAMVETQSMVYDADIRRHAREQLTALPYRSTVISPTLTPIAEAASPPSTAHSTASATSTDVLRPVRGVKANYTYTNRVAVEGNDAFTRMRTAADSASEPTAILRNGDVLEVVRDDVAGWYQARIVESSDPDGAELIGQIWWIERWLVDNSHVPISSDPLPIRPPPPTSPPIPVQPLQPPPLTPPPFPTPGFG